EVACPGCGARFRLRIPAAVGQGSRPPDAVLGATVTLGPRADEPERLGGYRILGVLGEGGMGIVYRAEDEALGRQVALKVLRPEVAADPLARQRFLREARAAAALNHDHILTIYQVGEDRGLPFIAMPLLRGETLEERLQREPRPTAAE